MSLANDQRWFGNSYRNSRRIGLVRRVLNTERPRLNDAQNAVSNLEREIRNLDSQITQKERETINAQSELSRLRSSRSTQQSRVNEAERLVRTREQETITAQRNLDDHRRTLNDAEREWRRQDSEADAAESYLQQVIANYNAALARVLQAADQAATTHATREAQGRAPAAADTDGLASARQVGNERGTSEGRTRDLASGYALGRRNAASSADLAQSYRGGVSLGEDAAVAKARAEDYPRGWNEALDTILAVAPANDATLDITSAIPNDPGGNGQDLDPRKLPIGTGSTPGFVPPVAPPYTLPVAGEPTFQVPAADFRFRDRPCSGLVLPEFEPRCRERYDATYGSAFRTQYGSIYREGFRSAFNANVRAAYDAGLAQNWPAETEAGRQRGAREQGVLDGFAARLPSARMDEFARGQAAVRTWLTTGHLLVVRSVGLVESSGDGLFSGGERASLKVVIDNYGATASPRARLRVRIASKNGFGTLSFETRELPALAANTRTTLLGVVSGPLLAAAKDARVGLGGSLERAAGASWTEVERINAEQSIRFPLELQSVTLAQGARVNEETTATLVFRNNLATDAAELPLSLATTGSQVTVLGADYKVPALDAGETASVDVRVKPEATISDTLPVEFRAKIAEVADGLTTEQLLSQQVQAARNAVLVLSDSAGRPIVSGSLNLRAARFNQVWTLFRFLSTTRQPGPFVIRYLRASNPGITTSNNSTVSVSFRDWQPNWTRSADQWQFDIAPSLRGQAHWIDFQLEDAGRVISVLRVNVNVQ